MRGGVFSVDLLEMVPGFICFKANGKTAKEDFRFESGGIRWQRIPPTERKGRVQTSTITVAILEEVSVSEIKINPKDIEFKATRGSGAGGQHRNMTDSAVQLTHLPSKIMVRCESERSQHQNKETALEILRSKLKKYEEESRLKLYNKERKEKVGSGMRGDKIRTIRLQDDIVINHLNDKKISAKLYLKGHLDLLY